MLVHIILHHTICIIDKCSVGNKLAITVLMKMAELTDLPDSNYVELRVTLCKESVFRGLLRGGKYAI